MMGWILILVLATFLALFFGVAIFQWLWNITMHQAFGLRPIAFWVAFRLLIIAGFLTSGLLININLGARLPRCTTPVPQCPPSETRDPKRVVVPMQEVRSGEGSK